MNKSMKCFALLLFLVAPTYCLATRPPTLPQSLPRHVNLHIKDKDVKGLKLWCESLDEVFDDVILQPGKETIHQIFLDWLYDCHFEWQSRTKTVPDMGKDCVDNKDCIWEVRTNGFWFYDNKKHWIKKDVW